MIRTGPYWFSSEALQVLAIKIGTGNGQNRNEDDDQEENAPENAKSPFVMVISVDTEKSELQGLYVGGNLLAPSSELVCSG